MNNLPLGAELDEKAPFNTNEKEFKFSVEITGNFYYEYFGKVDIDEFEIARMLKERIKDLILINGDIDLDKINVEVY